MNQAPDLPLWAAILVSALVLTGAAITLVGSIGLIRLRTFYERVHAPTIGSSLGTMFVVVGSMLCFSVLQSRIHLHEILIGIFVVTTTPVTFMLLARAAYHRDMLAAEKPAPPQE